MIKFRWQSRRLHIDALKVRMVEEGRKIMWVAAQAGMTADQLSHILNGDPQKLKTSKELLQKLNLIAAGKFTKNYYTGLI